MKRLIICLGFIISMLMSGVVTAQNDNELNKSAKNSLQEKDREITAQKWENSIEPFVGVWSLEKSSIDDQEEEITAYPCTFMVINSNATYTIFVYIDGDAIITSQGVILVDSSDEYIEVITYHVNKSLIGVSNRIDYTLTLKYLNKSFWIEKDRHGGDFKRQVNETWKRARIPAPGEYENNPAFPI
ncbi:MAG: DUF4488 domain-containing protein [Dysgonamonadaceae bacterium]|nr:DUF4488 domain-containing protein [Dysgonamonadaceae bacterium]MDD3355694.1 DUF4488 domain-containing protein [Dysgonamonadaceae bacterium]MDD3727113.1 DUF4488 domain-containing protein [Dysgonamonadaceae bacterium]MDD4246286.1 DUF4488 domain-containing protein [Dysgonamonadaceae bacterium]MDD4605338.1 DUF4488 domain-containing protein [Dysgonamonadaceae bacterium]